MSESAALEEVTEAAFSGVLRALEARKLPINKFPGPILIGIIAWPELQQGESSATSAKSSGLAAGYRST